MVVGLAAASDDASVTMPVSINARARTREKPGISRASTRLSALSSRSPASESLIVTAAGSPSFTFMLWQSFTAERRVKAPENTSENDSSMNALKALVIGMGILIVAGVAVIAVTIVRRNAEPVASDNKPAVELAQSGVASAPPSAPTTRGPLPSFGVRDIAVPAGSEIVSITAADGRIILELQDAEQVTRILLLDPANGAALGGWRLVESATSRGMTP